MTGYTEGKGRCAGKIGGIVCELPNGVEVTCGIIRFCLCTFHILLIFTAGTGLSDNDRSNPPDVGAVITFKYQELSSRGHPRFPVFLRERRDLTWEQVVESAKRDPPPSQTGGVAKTQFTRARSVLFSTLPSSVSCTAKHCLVMF